MKWLGLVIVLAAGPAFAVDPEYYCNGKRRVVAGDLYYPSGQRVFIAGDFYYPNAGRVTYAGDLLYPNGQRFLLAGDQYFMSGQRVNLAGDFYYPNGQRVQYAGDCYYQNGVRMGGGPCPPTVRYMDRTGAYLIKGALDLKRGLGDTLAFELFEPGLRTLFELDRKTGAILNIDAVCE